MRPEITTLLASRLRKQVEKQIQPQSIIDHQYVLFFTFCDKKSRAQSVTAAHTNFDEAWQIALQLMRQRTGALDLKIRWLRIDWVHAVRETSWEQLQSELKKYKRNYFRQGIALDAGFQHAFLETELNANAMLYGGAHIAHAVINEKNFLHYARRRSGLEVIDFSPEKKVYTFSTQAVFTALDQPASYTLHGSGRNTGRRVIESLTPALVNDVIASSSSYLGKQVKMNGRFHYGWHPCFDRPIPAYNALRHASSLFAIIEAWEVTRDVKLGEAINLSLKYLTGQLIRQAQLPDGRTASFLVESNKEIKLGGNAVCLLALSKYSQVTGSREYLALLEELAIGITAMQDPATGKFNHVYIYPTLELKEEFRIIYYDGEAAYGLMRLYALTKDTRWLQTVEKAFDYFIAAEHWKAHDHWLSYCVNELTQYRPEERYFRFGIKNVADHLDFVHHRITTFPTLLELMMAAREMISRISEMPDMHHLLAGIDLVKFQSALEHRAQYLLNGYFWPELAMFYECPQKILGSFFIRHHSFRVRIDDVEHYLSGFVAYLKYLKEQKAFNNLVKSHADNAALTEFADGQNWSSDRLLAATGGKWITAPADGWHASGLCIFAPAMQDKNIIIAKSNLKEKGILPSVITRLKTPPAAIIVTDPTVLQATDCPVLQVEDVDKAILNMGVFARDQMRGHVCAVTGSAGKSTTSAMLAHVLQTYGKTGLSANNANRPHGVAWNLASIDWNCEHVVLELAIGLMGISSRMARPGLVIFTNVLPVHLSDKTTIHDIAVTKSAIFNGMKAGDTAILNKNMQEWKTVQNAALNRELNIIEYGTTSDCAFQLLSYDAQSQMVTARLRGIKVEYHLGAAGEHMALNSVAVLAAIIAFDYPLNTALERLRSFKALSGRGEQSKVSFNGNNITIIDDAYNANTGSMQAALVNLSEQKTAIRRIAVLGEMAELGLQATQHHTDLAPFISSLYIDKVFVTGDHYRQFWEQLPDRLKGAYCGSVSALGVELLDNIQDGDIILFKGSNSTHIHELVQQMKNNGALLS